MNVRSIHCIVARASFLRLAGLALIGSGLVTAVTAWGQIAPSGYTSAINTPTADVLSIGSVGLALSNANPERPRLFPGVGATGSVNLGFGVLPGLELISRLAYEGDLHCTYWDAGCRAGLRDLSASGKYVLPWRLSSVDGRVALGFTDYGGGATNFRQTYGVASATVWGATVSAGRSRAQSAWSLMDGNFASVVVPVADKLSLLVESDTREYRAGARGVLPLARDLDLGITLSRKLSERTAQPAMQAGVNLIWYWGGRHPEVRTEASTTPTYAAGLPHSASGNALPAASSTPAAPPGAPAVRDATLGVSAGAALSALAVDYARRLEADGFVSVRVARAPEGGWWVQAEPRGTRRSSLQALGRALALWLQAQPASREPLIFTLLWVGEPRLSLRVSRECLEQVRDGRIHCDAAEFAFGAAAGDLLSGSDGAVGRWETLLQSASTVDHRPQLEVGPALRQFLGVENGLAHYSLALDTGVEIDLAKGLQFQGNVLTPLSHSAQFGPGGDFQSGRYRQQVESARLAWWTPLTRALSAQISAGTINHSDRGGQLDVAWLSDSGRWRLSGLVGHYLVEGDPLPRRPALASARYSVIPGAWHVEATAGQFYQSDVGLRVASTHWFGNRSVSFFVRESKTLDNGVMPRTRFAGFTVSLPIGPDGTLDSRWMSLRGADRWTTGLESKIGARDNALTSGYGVVPRLRHGLRTDGTDYDRAGREDLAAGFPVLAQALRQALAGGER